MEIANLLQNHQFFKAHKLNDRFFKHEDVNALLDQLPSSFRKSIVGSSFEGRSISLVEWGTGPTKVFLWSQMHGDEATGTMALFDLFQYLQSDGPDVSLWFDTCTLYMMPMVNPDGAARFTRRNAQQIDINRDYLETASPEAQLLKSVQQKLRPDFGFNLHDQSTLWSVQGSRKPATISLLAPAVDEALTINSVREQAMLVIADIFRAIHPHLPGHVGLFDEEFEPRAFGDNFQKSGMSTLLIEAGGYGADFEKQEIRSFYVAALAAGLRSIVTQSYLQQTTSSYFSIPKNQKQLFHFLIQKLTYKGIQTTVGIDYEEMADVDGKSVSRVYSVEDLGDLRFFNGYNLVDGSDCKLVGHLNLFQPAHFKLLFQGKVILAFEHGKLLENL